MKNTVFIAQDGIGRGARGQPDGQPRLEGLLLGMFHPASARSSIKVAKLFWIQWARMDGASDLRVSAVQANQH